jgi:hypothetical protein
MRLEHPHHFLDERKRFKVESRKENSTTSYPRQNLSTEKRTLLGVRFLFKEANFCNSNVRLASCIARYTMHHASREI